MLVHSPHTREQQGLDGPDSVSGSDISLLNINQQINMLAAGRLDTVTDGDFLVVGTPTNVLAYDINNNRDLFYNDVTIIQCHEYAISISAPIRKVNFLLSLPWLISAFASY